MLPVNHRKRIINRHRHSVWLHGYQPQALYWENRAVQEQRFEVLLACGMQSGDSVLDVGCGFADFYHFAKVNAMNIDYSGLDLSPDMIAGAQAQAPELDLYCGDLFDFNPADQAYDWVILSGALNEPLQDEAAYLREILPRLFAACRKGIAFNLLNAAYDWQAQQLYTLQPYVIDEVMAILQGLSPYRVYRDDYLASDVSYFVWRDMALVPDAPWIKNL